MKEFFFFFPPAPSSGPSGVRGHYSTARCCTIKSRRKNAAEESLRGRRQHMRPSGVRKKKRKRRSSRKQEQQHEPPGEASRSRSFFISHFLTLRLTFFASFKHGRLPLAGRSACVLDCALHFLYMQNILRGKKNEIEKRRQRWKRRA